MSRPARRPARIRPPHRGRTPSVSLANRPTREVQPFVRPVPPRSRRLKHIILPPKEDDLTIVQRLGLLSLVLVILLVLGAVLINVA